MRRDVVRVAPGPSIFRHHAGDLARWSGSRGHVAGLCPTCPGSGLGVRGSGRMPGRSRPRPCAASRSPGMAAPAIAGCDGRRSVCHSPSGSPAAGRRTRRARSAPHGRCPAAPPLTRPERRLPGDAL